MEKRPAGVRDSLYRHKCLNVSAKRYSDLSDAVIIGGVLSARDSFFNNNIWSISNFIQDTWDEFQPQDIEEERALMFMCGTYYGEPSLRLTVWSYLEQAREKMGIDFTKDAGIKRETIRDVVVALVGETDNDWQSLEADGKQEVIGKIRNPVEN